jgi:threonine synthase
MKFKSTRGEDKFLSFVDAVMEGLPSDGGLMVPCEWPQVSAEDIKKWSSLSYNVSIIYISKRK